MGKREKKLKAAKTEEYSSSEEGKRKRKTPIAVAGSDDDAEANEDLSLKIVQKSIKRTVKNDPRSNGVSEIVMEMKEEKKKKEKKKRKKSKETEAPEDFVSSDIDTGFRDFCGELFLLDNVKDEEKTETNKAKGDKAKSETDKSKGDKVKALTGKSNGDEAKAETDKSKGDKMEAETDKANAEIETDKAAEISVEADETNPVGVSDNVVLRKLLRGPRYFDPPDNSWGACYNCGEEGHTSVNCTSARRKKPCFVCGSFEHNAKQCNKGRDCFICKQHGHRAKDCPEKYNNSKVCLKCGDFGHEMFSCRNAYCPDDLKEIQCYICGTFGHLCCTKHSDPGPREDSCYRCGQSGHTGLACAGPSRGGGDTNDVVYYANSCYKCGLVGHFARECTTSVKSGKRNREPSTPRLKSSKKIKDSAEVKSAPHDLGKTRKKKKTQYGEYTSPVKTKKHRGGWMTEHPGDYSNNYSNKRMSNNNWRSPATPTDRRSKMYSPNDDYASTSHSFQKPHKINFNNSASNRSNGFYQHRFSASRFGNNSNYGTGRNYDDRW